MSLALDPFLKPSVTFIYCLASLCLSCLNYKMGIIISTSPGCCEELEES